MTKKQRPSEKKVFWIYFVVALLISSLIYWYYFPKPQADEAATATSAGACSVNVVLAIDTSHDMTTKVGSQTRLAAAVASANAVVDHFAQVNANSASTAVKAKIGLRSFPNNAQQVALTSTMTDVKTKLDALKADAARSPIERIFLGGSSNGNTLSAGLRGAHNVLKAGGPTSRESSYIIVITAAQNSEADEDDGRTATRTAVEIKSAGVTIVSAAFDNNNLARNVSSSAANTTVAKTPEALTTFLNTIAEDTCPKNGIPQVASCSANMDIAYLMDDTAAFGDDATVRSMSRSVVSSIQGKLIATRDRAAAIGMSSVGTAGYVRHTFDTDLAKATTAINALQYRQTGNFDQGVNATSAYVRANRRVEGGKLTPTSVIIITDEKGAGTTVAQAKAKQDFERYGIRYYVVKIGPAAPAQFATLNTLATGAGGKAYDVRNSNNADTRAANVAAAVNDIATQLASNVANCVDVSLSLDNNNVKEGEQVVATYLVTNNSRAPISQAKVTQSLPTGLTATANPVVLTFDTEILPGATATKTVTLTAAAN